LVITMDGALFRDGKPVTLVSGAARQPGVTAVADTSLVTGPTGRRETDAAPFADGLIAVVGVRA